MGVHFQVQGAPEPGDIPHDAFLVHLRVRNNITDRNRKNPGTCPELIVNGVEGWLWHGFMSSPRMLIWPPGQPSGKPYTAASNDKEDIEKAAQNFRGVSDYLTRRTAAMVCVDRHAPPVPSGWWVADKFPENELSASQADEFKAAAKAAFNGGEAPVPVPAPQPAKPRGEQLSIPVTPKQGPGRGRQPNPDTERYPCRYTNVTDCDYVGGYGARYVHSETDQGPHMDHAIILMDCPVCGKVLPSVAGRNQHVSQVHGITADSAERAATDLQQTTMLWRARGQRLADQLQETVATFHDEVRADANAELADDDIADVVDAFRARRAYVPDSEPEAQPEPEPALDEDLSPVTQPAEPLAEYQEISNELHDMETAAQLAGDPRITALRSLIADWESMAAKAAEADQLRDEAGKLRKELGDLEAKHALVREALGL